MSHLTDEQLEEFLSADAILEDSHAAQCRFCRDRLAQRKAIAERLRTTFLNINPPAGLQASIREQLRVACESSGQTKPLPVRTLGFLLRQRWRGLAAAAMFLLVAVPLYYFVNSPTPVQAAQAELVKIHQHNLSSHQEFLTSDDPQDLAQYFRKQLGFTPEFPTLSQGMALRGCCVTHFKNQPIGSYVVNTPHGFVSIIVVEDHPEGDLGMTEYSTNRQRLQWIGTSAICNMAAVRLNDYTYCAVGEVSHETLIELLNLLVQPAQLSQKSNRG